MLEKWVGKSVTYYVMGEEGYTERLLVAVDVRGIYVKDDAESAETIFVPYSSLRSITFTAG